MAISGARQLATAKRHDEIGQLGRDFNQMAERIESMVAAKHRPAWRYLARVALAPWRA